LTVVEDLDRAGWLSEQRVLEFNTDSAARMGPATDRL
jgi:hypothetical protein